MKTVKVEKSELLTHLSNNRKAHIVEYDQAILGYREALVQAFAKALKEAKAGKDISHTVSVTRPKNYVEHYDKIISMLEWTTDEFIELDQMEFTMYVQDEWAWKNDFKVTSSLYNGK